MKKRALGAALITGAFDPLHSGHLDLIDLAFTYCRYVYVGVHHDKRVIANKGYLFTPYEDRIRIIKSLNKLIKVRTVKDGDKGISAILFEIRRNHRVSSIIYLHGRDARKDNLIEESRFCMDHENMSLVYWMQSSDVSSRTLLERMNNEIHEKQLPSSLETRNVGDIFY